MLSHWGGGGEDRLYQIAGSSRSSKVHASANAAELATLFGSIAANKKVVTLLESEVAKQMSEAVSDELSLLSISIAEVYSYIK